MSYPIKLVDGEIYVEMDYGHSRNSVCQDSNLLGQGFHAVQRNGIRLTALAQRRVGFNGGGKELAGCILTTRVGLGHDTGKDYLV